MPGQLGGKFEAVKVEERKLKRFLFLDWFFSYLFPM